MLPFITSNICIACLASENQKFVLFNSTMKDMYNSCTNLEVLDKNRMSQGLCYDCSQLVEQFFLFKTKCINSYKFLQNQKNASHVNNVIIDLSLPQNQNRPEEKKQSEGNIIISDASEKITQNSKLSLDSKSKNKYESDMKEHNVEKPAVCKICGKAYSKRHSLLQHMVIHTGEKKFICHCGKGFYYKGAYNEHVKIHGGEEFKTFICDECGKGFHTNAELKHHKFSHTEVTPVKCNLCSKSFKNNQCLRAHIQRHSKTRKHVCPSCGKSTVTKAELRIHLRTHTYLKLFKCELCTKEYRVRSALYTHRLSHTGLRKYKCEACSKLFITGGSLKTHMLVHTQEKPHKCNICDTCFSQKSSLKTHMKRHDKNH